MMRLATLLLPTSDRNLRLAAQCGVSEIVSDYPGKELASYLAMRRRIESFGLKWTVIERFIPHDKLVHNLPGRDEQLEEFKRLIRNAAEAGVSVLCYNWMPSDDWTRTSVDTLERGGAKVTAFDANERPKTFDHYEGSRADQAVTTADDLWGNLQYFLDAVVPVAERAGVRLALHPDDPPTSPLNGKPQILTSIAAMQRAMQMVPSPSNACCFCQGTFASAGEDIVSGIQRLKEAIAFVHFRDVVGKVPRFRESFHDNGQTDMVAAMQTYCDLGLDVPIRPDHAPSLEGETNENPGYEMLGRLFAYGYIRGLMQSAERHAAASTSIGSQVR